MSMKIKQGTVQIKCFGQWNWECGKHRRRRPVGRLLLSAPTGIYLKRGIKNVFRFTDCKLWKEEESPEYCRI